MELCSRCNKRVAVVFITKIENGKSSNEGLCLKCAKELGLPQVNDIINKLGLSDEDLDRMEMEVQGLVEASGAEDSDDDDGEPSSRTPPIDFQKLIGGSMIPDFPRRIFDQGGAGTGAGEGEGDSRGAGKGGEKKSGREKKDPKRKFLDLYCQSLNVRAKEGKLDRIIGRERELSRLIQILCRRQKNNPCLIGEPGVGKTAIAEALAQRIGDGNVPYKLQDKEVLLVDMTSLVAGTQFRGQFETRMKGLIEEAKNLGNIILVIDEVHSIVGAGDAEGSMNAANILKPALSKGDVQVIGATTMAEYRKYIEKDSALERRFQPIVIEEPSLEDSVEILKGIKGYYEIFHGVKIPDETVRAAVYLSERYITDRFLPDKAIDLLDEAASYLALNTPAIGRTAELRDALAKVRSEAEALEFDQNYPADKLEDKYRLLADLKTTELNTVRELDAAVAQAESVCLTKADLAAVIEIWTGIPAANINEHEFARVDRLADRLKERIVGQDQAVEAVARAVKRSRAGVSYKRKPVSFIFAGPTGVGKTELVKTLANDLFDSPETLIRLDMSEFMEKHSVSRIIGAPPGYVGYDEAGQLTEKIRRKPYSVVLFDEIEKAHPDVLNILLQILDDGRITDAHGKQVNFENTIIVMTTNAGSVSVSNTAGFGGSELSISEDRTMRALSDFLRPEFLNRVDEIITFRALDENDFVKIAAIMIGDLRKVLAEKEIALNITDEAVNLIAKASFSRKFGARNMRRYIQTHVEDAAANLIIESYNDRVTAINVAAEGETLAVTADRSGS
ncbi:MAG: ATP-dependent Clp protease ATP-binding subunit [Clostridiales bacterium]|nr:ATP-dependent Clp protease ATP-binding subunit [Clostridiales bacterium]